MADEGGGINRTVGDRLVSAYTWVVIALRWPIALAAIAACFYAAMGLQQITFSNNYRYFFSPENPQYKAFVELQDVYSKRDALILVIQPKRGDVFQPKLLEEIKWLTEESWKLPFVVRVDSITNFQYTAVDGDDLAVADLFPNPSAMSPQEIERAKAFALSDPLLKNRLISPDARTTAVALTMILPEKELTEAKTGTDAGRELRRRFQERYPDAHVALTGNVPMSNAFSEATQSDLTTLLPLMYVVIILLTALILRSVGALIVLTTVIFFSTVAAMGLAGWTHIVLTPPSSISPIIILTLAVADVVHIVNAFFVAMRKGMAKNQAIVEAMRVNFLAVFLTSLTTAIGFWSLNFSDAPPFRDLGTIVTFGVGLAWALSVTLLPAMLAIIPFRMPARVPEEDRLTVMDRLAEFVIRRRRFLLYTTAAITVGLAIQIPRIELNDQFVKWFAPSIEFRRDTDFYLENLSGVYQIEYSIRSGESQGVTNPEFMRKVAAFEEWAYSQPDVQHVFSYIDIMRRLNRNMNGDDPAYYRLPEDRTLAAQYLLLYELSLPLGLDLNDQLNVDKSATRVIITMTDVTAEDVRSLKRRGDAWLAQALPQTMSDAQGAGTAVMFSFIAERNINSMLIGTGAALILISLSLIIPFWSFKFGVVSLIPNLAPAVLTFGLWAIVEGRVGMASSIVIASSLGMVVDATIHLLSKYLRARRIRGESPEDAVRYAFSTVGPALWLLTVLLIAGFGILALSPFEVNRALGELTAIAIFFAIFCDFLMLPPLLMAIDKPRKETSPAAAEPVPAE